MLTLPLPNWLPVVLSLTLLAGFVWRTLWVKRTTGENPNKLGFDDSVMGLCGRTYMRLSLFLSLYLVARLVWPSTDSFVGTIPPLVQPILIWLGLGLAVAGIGFALYAQSYMATSWRIGIPSDKPGSLVTGGPYAISRNPFFLGSMVYYFGLFFMMPNALTAVVLSGLVLTTSIQIRIEEEFLEKALGEPYRAFKSKVRRWI